MTPAKSRLFPFPVHLFLVYSVSVFLYFTAFARAAPAKLHSHAGGFSPAAARAHKLLEQGIASLALHQFPEAEQALVDSFRAEPSAEALFYLGALALAQGRLLEAQDLMR